MKKIFLFLIALSSLGTTFLLADTNDDNTNGNSPIGIIIPPPTPTPDPNDTNSSDTNSTPPLVIPNQAQIGLYPIPTSTLTNGQPADFDISATCVTTRQYCAFLNAVAQQGDPFDLYTPKNIYQKGIYLITRNGYIPPFYYTVNDGVLTIPNAYNPDGSPYTIAGGEYPITFVSLLNAARFCNWVENGEPTNLPEGPGSTETGSYIITTNVVTTNSFGLVSTNNSPAMSKILLQPGAHWRLLGYYLNSNTNTPGRDANGNVNEWMEALASFQPLPQDQGALAYQWMDVHPGINAYNPWLQISTMSSQTRGQGINNGFSDTGFRLIYFP